jgi:hypothetical protein
VTEQQPNSGGLTLVVETPDRVYVRMVPAATPLDSRRRRGAAAEEAAHDAASAGGLPDFVFPASTERVSSGNGELGDALIIIGRQGVVVQVKSRDAASMTVEHRERRWVDKQVSKALRQARGTVRLLCSRPFDLVKARGLSIRALARCHAVHRRTVRQALADATPPPRKVPGGWLRPPAAMLILFDGG